MSTPIGAVLELCSCTNLTFLSKTGPIFVATLDVVLAKDDTGESIIL